MQATTKTTVRKLLAMILCFVLFISAIPPLHHPAQATPDYFHDDYVFSFYEDYTWDTFDEDGLSVLEYQMIEPLLVGNASRAEATALIVMAMDPNLLTNPNTPNIVGRFSDVRPQDWFYPVIAWAVNRGWVQGNGDGTFRPNNQISREEMVVLAVRARDPRHSNRALTFRDTHLISPWALPYIRRAVENGWVQGTPDGFFNPTHSILRVDAQRLVNNITGRNVPFPNNIRTITWNANGGTGVPTWQRLSGSVLGQPFPSSIRANLSSSRWFNTTNISGGIQTTASTSINSNITYFLRWHDTSRHMGWWWPSTSVPLRAFNFNATWQTPINNGIGNWESSSRARFPRNQTSNNQVIAQPFDYSELGSHIPISWTGSEQTGFSITEFRIELNSRTISSHSSNNGYTLSRVITSVMAHELGHAVGLEDRSTSDSIMNTNRSRNIVLGPSVFDVQSFNLLHR